VQFRGGSQNLSPAFAKSARITVVEVDEIVEVGELPPESVTLPGIFVSRVFKSERPFAFISIQSNASRHNKGVCCSRTTRNRESFSMGCWQRNKKHRYCD
jgi:acyl CoA:acetate/3-ketoacid CoA transferase